jgi:hypothetical protein
MDRYEKALLEATERLKECQKSEKLDSCLPCEKSVECKTRQEYVSSVYKSMMKDNTGGFDFS